jgi:hypothetical protein
MFYLMRRHIANGGLTKVVGGLRRFCSGFFMLIRLADNFCVPGSATVSVAPVGVSPTDVLPTNRIGTVFFTCVWSVIFLCAWTHASHASQVRRILNLNLNPF